jgi:hypothetical protein
MTVDLPANLQPENVREPASPGDPRRQQTYNSSIVFAPLSVRCDTFRRNLGATERST